MHPPSNLRRLIGLFAALAALSLIAASCGSDDVTADDSEAPSSAGADAEDDEESADGDEAADTESSESDDAMEDDADAEVDAMGDFPRTVETAAGDVIIDAPPQSIISLSPTATEMLFAIGAGDEVVAVDLFSNYPEAAPEGTLDGFTPDLEAILSAGPDLVVAAGLPEDVSAGLADAGVSLIILPAAASFDDTYDQIAQLGEATDQIDGAAAVNAEIRDGVAAVVAELPDRETPVRVFHEIDDSFYTATSGSFIGQVYTTMGFDNIADPLDDGSGYPLIDGESIIAADPTLIVFTDQASYTADDIVARPGWDTTTAVSEGNVLQVDADIASRWGPRIVEFMQAVADATAVGVG